MELFDIKGKTAIVTGGSRGIGNAIARGYHEAGAKVVLVASSDRVKLEAEAMSSEEAPVYYCKADLSDRDNIPKVVEECRDKLGGRIDILVNNAGIQYRCKAEDYPMEEWDRILNLNLTTVFYMAQQTARVMIEQNYGKIINIASMCSFFGSVMIPAYTASKGGVAQLTKALSNEWASKGINVNAIAPGYIKTEISENLRKVNPKQYDEVITRIPAGRWGEPEDLQGTAIFLASDASKYLSGAVIPVDGGYMGR